MSDHPHPVESAHPAEHAHPTAGKYIQIAIILGVITALEVAIYYIHELASVLPILLITLSAVKFGTVAAFYMHLKFDHPLFTFFFVGGLALAASVVLAVMTLLGAWWQVPLVHPAAH